MYVHLSTFYLFACFHVNISLVYSSLLSFPGTYTDKSLKQPTFWYFQAELYEIEEEKLLKPQEQIDLSLKLIKSSSSSKSEVSDGKINVAEMDSSNKLKLKTNTVDNVLLGGGWNPRDQNNTLPRRLNRAQLKLEAAKVISTTIQLSPAILLIKNYFFAY